MVQIAKPNRWFPTIQKARMYQMVHPPSHATVPPPRRSARLPKSGCAPNARPALKAMERRRVAETRNRITPRLGRGVIGPSPTRPMEKARGILKRGQDLPRLSEETAEDAPTLADRAWPQTACGARRRAEARTGPQKTHAERANPASAPAAAHGRARRDGRRGLPEFLRRFVQVGSVFWCPRERLKRPGSPGP